ncbi:MAG: mitochondrial splicing system protein [Bogoriella megaspora]|nr:MAG: mitochondrial splicing system protein [Bogoriella megaspora]
MSRDLPSMLCRQLLVYNALCPDRPLPKPRQASIRTLYDPSKTPSVDTTLDPSALILYFPTPQTLTGESILELHVHGGPAVVRAVLSAISRCIPPSLASQFPIRYAEPGEFTRRAFLNDRLSLPQIEALGETLTATTEQQRKLSVRGASAENSLASTYEAWRQQLLYARGELEALIDFAEDQSFEESPAQLVAGVSAQISRLSQRIQVHSQNAVKGELLRNGINLALLGQPNAGKSSLLNRILGREAAIVSREAGTTRDVVEVGVDLGGWFVRLGDMAGLRENRPSNNNDTSSTTESGVHIVKVRNELRQATADVVGEIEAEGIRRAKQRALDADVVLVVLSFEEEESPTLSPTGGRKEPSAIIPPTPTLQLESSVIDTARRCRNVVVAVNKIDLFHAAISSADQPVSSTIANRAESGDVAHASASAPATPSGSGSGANPVGWVQAAVQEALPDVPASRIFTISCKHAELGTAATATSQQQRGGHVEARPDGSHGHHLGDGDEYSAAARDPGGIQTLLQGLIAEFETLTTPLMLGIDGAAEVLDRSTWQESLGATERQRKLLDECSMHLNHFLSEVHPGRVGELGGVGDEIDVVVAAEHLRAAAECLAKITGKGEGSDVEEVLGVVFEK